MATPNPRSFDDGPEIDLDLDLGLLPELDLTCPTCGARLAGE